MDILLTQIKDYLVPQLSWVRRHDVCLIPHPGVIPEEVGFPYVGLKDGNVTNHERPGEVLEQELMVEIYIYDELDRSGDNIPSLHEKSREIRDLLRGNDLGEAVVGVDPTAELAVTLLFTKKGMVVRKGLRFKYEREVTS